MDLFAALLTCLCLLILSSASAYGSIPLGSSLSSKNTGVAWTSPSGDFAFGFYPVPGNLFVVGIWFDRIPGKTLVWTANRDKPAARGSTVQLTADGTLVLKDGRGAIVMTIASSPSGGVASAAMLDSGNFVLQGSAGSADLKWQSFDHPTDTILPGQVLNPESELRAASSDSDLSTGKFFLKMQSDGNLVLNRDGNPIDQYNIAYASNTAGTPGKLVFDGTGSIYILRSDNTKYVLTPSGSVPIPASSSYQRATLGYDGVFRQYTFPKTSSSSSSSQTWTRIWATTEDPCTVPGICGVNGYCVLGADQKPRCLCPNKYSYLDPSNMFMGCKNDFPVQDCRGGQQYVLESIANVDWPFGDYEMINNMDEERCRAACMSDCLCTVAIYRVQTCWKKKVPLFRGRMNVDIQSVALIKVPK
ncbi:G-type lectin S-receptor-like serine/threonine-protein kinase LECRK4 [Nymphaea colorata]|nr:G-type lectin S-receptor-like serine/threonine-protein kinase LECRK4 [Nymphaea colorata]